MAGRGIVPSVRGSAGKVNQAAENHGRREGVPLCRATKERIDSGAAAVFVSNGRGGKEGVDRKSGGAVERTAKSKLARTTMCTLGSMALMCLILLGTGSGREARRPSAPVVAPPLKILVSNDDGIEAPGIVALADALRKVGTVTVAAPVKDESGVSHAMTGNTLVSVRESDHGGQRWFAIDALPATCVRMAIETLMPDKPDIVVAGVNKGENMGVVTFYSATVACAREASFLGIPAVAVHLQRGGAMDYALAAEFTAALVRTLASKGLMKGLFLNVNIPAQPKDKIRGVMVTPQDMRPAAEIYEKRETRNGQAFYWATYKPLDSDGKRTDVWAVRDGYISITPMIGDQTPASAVAGLRGLEKLVW